MVPVFDFGAPQYACGVCLANALFKACGMDGSVMVDPVAEEDYRDCDTCDRFAEFIYATVEEDETE